MNALREECQQLHDELIALRREFHRAPELGLHEYHTAARIERELDRCGIPHERVGETAVVGHLTGNGNGSGLVVLRADIDALPIQETNDVPYRSQTPGMMHACGHDAHTTCLLGAAKVLSAHRADFGGEVRFLFQPAEEIGQGARPLIAAGMLDGAQRVFGLHTASDLPAGTVGVRPGANNAGVDHFIIRIHGKSAHVSTPQLGVDALYIASDNTSISDAEVEYEEKDGSFWHLLYPVKETGEMLELATTRPETMLGDTAVAINGEDPRYAHLHGCHVVLPLLNKEIPIVCDEHADMTKGTGVVKITPAHDPNDFEVGLRHDLPIVRVFTYDGHMTGAADKAAADALFASGKNTINEPEVLDCGKYAGMTTLEARKAILADLKEGGFLKEIEPLKHEVGTCYRCHSTIEPMVSKQWFVKMEPLAKPAIESVEKGEIKFVPERFTKNYMNWMKGTRDWCISRQLWWGHQIPAWYCDDCGETVVAKTAPCTCPKCGGSKLTQDPDTLDTWFSSALWPFSTLGWPNEDSADLKYFYPTNTLVTGYDIIGFWVSRMIFSGLAYTGKAPFSTVCIHGIVRDSQGRKMSKSLGNGIDPLEVIAQYGADALRFMLVDGSTPGNDMRYIEKKVEAARNFANKLWNATRFVLMNLPEDFEPGLPSEELLDMSDKWVLTKLNQVAGAMTDNLDHYEMGLAAAKINSFIWDVYCDWFIEIAKPRLNSGDAEQADTARRVLVYVLDKALKLLHPFMPFITEELYQALPGSGESIMIQSWPTFDEAHNWAAEEEAFEKVMDYIKAVRTMRTEMNVHPAKKTSMIIETADAAPFQNAQVYLAKFAFATDVTFTEKYEGSTDGMVQVSTHAARGFIPMMELIDRDKELARLNKEKAKAEKELAMFGNQLANPKFVERAPAALVEDIRAKYAKSQDKLANIEQSIQALG